MEYEREVVSRDGADKAKVWMRPATAADILAIEDSDTSTNADLIARQVIRWELPDLPTVETINRLDILIFRQLSELIEGMNNADPAKKEAAPADPLKGSGGSSEPSKNRPLEHVAS